jgi:C-terminal peptidase prc
MRNNTTITKMQKNTFIALLLILLTVLLASGCSGYFAPDGSGDPNQADNSEIYTELSYNHALLEIYYLYAKDELQPLGYYEGKGNGSPYGDVTAMFQSMTDRFTNYWTPEEAGPLLKSLTTSGDIPLIGIEITVKKDESGTDRVAINRVYPNSPAEGAGLEKGDYIYTISGEELKGENVLEQFQAMTNGGAETPVNMTVIRGKAEIVIPTMYKKIMLLPTVFLDYLNDIPVIQLTGFTTRTTNTAGTVGEFRAILRRLDEEHKNAVGIIDLRGNPGGSVDQCFDIIEELVATGLYIQYEDHYYNDRENAPAVDLVKKHAVSGGLGEKTRWVFLADGNSASASEILLFAVTNCRPETKVYGSRTYGKGIGQYYIQSPIEGGLAGISGLKFYDKTGYSYHDEGIEPDVKEDDPDLALGKAAAYAASLTGRRSVEVVQPSPVDIRALSHSLAERQQKAAPGGAWRIIAPGETFLDTLN